MLNFHLSPAGIANHVEYTEQWQACDNRHLLLAPADGGSNIKVDNEDVSCQQAGT